jgi:16S rRNA (uracil1498-N3)-methyltransferase
MTRNKERDADGLVEEPGGKVRLFVEAALAPGAKVALNDAQAHYLIRVMRAGIGDRLLLFNGKDGEWRAEIVETKKHGGTLVCEARTEPQTDVPDLWLVFAPIKKTPADYVAQKATELGVRVLQPVLTHRTIARRVNTDRLKANAIEAAEQCGILNICEIGDAMPLSGVLAQRPADRVLIFCDEDAPTRDPVAALSAISRGSPLAVLVGPEGGFAEEEREMLLREKNIVRLALGPRILRADTAAIVALTLAQTVLGDWR